MPNDTIDQAFARHVRQIGLVTQEQVNIALQTQAESLKQGKTLTFSEVLVQMGIITPTQRESLEQRVRDQQAGVQQLGPYKLVRKLGEGGMGAVYLATGPDGKSVAVKVLPRNLGGNAEFVKRFRREADAATKLKHPNIIGAFAAGEDLGYHYYVMEYCDGMPLDKLLLAKKFLPVGQAVALTLDVARALKYAHDLGIVHRDIKPANIMLDRDGQAKVLDLGLSKDLADTAMSFKTVTGAVLGTPHYISPEQAQGERVVDGRSDIYSLGATLYHFLTGKTPFEGGTALEILSKHVHTVLPNPQDVKEGIPDPVVHVLERMMAKDPSDRYADCGELIAELVEASQGRTPKSTAIAAALTTIAPSARRAPPKKRPASIRRQAAKSSPNPLWLIAGAFGVAAVVLLVVVMSRSPEPDSNSTSPPARPPTSRTGDSERPGSDAAAWEQSLAELPPEARVRNVLARLKALNPGYDGSGAEHQVNHGRVSRLRLAHPSLNDLAPLRGLPDLRELELVKTGVSDLRPLRALKELSVLSLTGLPLKDLSALEGLEFARLTVKDCPAADLSSLKRVRLRELYCDFDPKRDTEPLKSMPALEQINGVPIEEFWRRLRSSEPAAAANPKDPFSPVLAKLKQLNPEWVGRETHAPENGAVTELVLVAVGLTDLSPLSSLTSLRKLDASGYWSASEDKEYRSGLRDLSPLRGLPLRELIVHHSEVADLAPLDGMRLEVLDVGATRVNDLSPLRGMPLTDLCVAFTAVKSLAPVAGAPLTILRIQQSSVSDYSLLSGMPIRNLQADLDTQKHLALIKSIHTLERVNHTSVAEFLKAAAPVPVSAAEAALWKKAINLIPSIDPARDTVLGPWRKDAGKIYCDGGESAVLRIPYEPPAEYDLRVALTRINSHCSTILFLYREGRSFFFDMSNNRDATAGFADVSVRPNPTRRPFKLDDGRRYVSVIEVRHDRVTALIDGQKICEWLPSMGDLSAAPGWCVDIPGLIGLGNCETFTTFDVIELREVTGQGRVRTNYTTPPDEAFLKSLAALPAAEQLRRVVDRMQSLNLGFDGRSIQYKTENDRITEFTYPGSRLTDAWPLRGLTSLRKLEIGNEREPGLLSDLGFLRGTKLSELSLLNTRVSDLSPLQGMPLSRLQLNGGLIKDLGPLRGSKIAWLSISGCPVIDLAPLRDVPLQKLDCDRAILLDASVLKTIRTLKTVNGLPVAEFFKVQKDIWEPVFDGRTTDCLRNPLGWKAERGSLVNDPSAGVANPAQTRFEFENGDLRIHFEGEGWDSLSFRVRQGEKGASGIFFDGAACRTLTGRPHELTFSCRGDAVAATLDGKSCPLTENQPVKFGCLQFNAGGGSLRILSVEYRPAP
jgi:serine/threonine protein kinase/Leucine-rich repeat (LRR) protein